MCFRALLGSGPTRLGPHSAQAPLGSGPTRLGPHSAQAPLGSGPTQLGPHSASYCSTCRDTCDVTTRLLVTRFHKQITEKSTATVEEQSEAVQEFYTVSATSDICLDLALSLFILPFLLSTSLSSLPSPPSPPSSR